MKIFISLALVVVLASIWMTFFPHSKLENKADTVFINGKIYTLDSETPWVDAVAVAAGRYIARGSNEEIRKLVGKDTEIIDLHGKMAMPGINDAHSHMYGGVKTLYFCNFDPSSNLAQIEARLRECIADNPQHKMLMGGYWVSSFFDDNQIDSPRAWLDRIGGPDMAIILSDDSGHNVWVNSAALKQKGYTAATVDPKGGTILRDDNGVPNGLAYEVAAERLESFFYEQWPESVLKKGLQYTLSTINSYGITGFKDAAIRSRDLRTLHKMDVSEGITAHIAASLFTPYGPREEALDYDSYSDLAKNTKSTNVHTDFIKFFLDGVPTSSRTAAMLNPYIDDGKHDKHAEDGTKSGNFGMLHLEGDLLANDLIELDKRGFTIKLHAAGDRSVREALDAIEKVRKVSGNKDKMHEIAHAGFIDDKDLIRFKELNVAADISPYLWFPSPIMDNIISVVGDLGEHYFPNRTLLNKGVTIIAGSDWPSVSLTPNPWPGIEATVTRKDPTGKNKGVHWKEQKLSLEETLKIFTINGAKALKLLDVTGTVEVGKYADFIVLKENLFEIPNDKISETIIEQTWFKGKKVWGK